MFPSRPKSPVRIQTSGDLLDTAVQNALLQNFREPELSNLKTILEHFAKATVSTLSSGLASEAAWREALPLLASKHRFVTHGMLAAAALHLSQLGETHEERDSFHDIAAAQMNIGMTQYRAEIQNVTTQNAEALFAFSTTTTTYVLKTASTECDAMIKSIISCVEPENAASTARLVHTVCRIFRALRGVLVILVPCWDQIRGGPLQPVVQRDWWPPAIPVTEEELEVDRKLRMLEKMWSRPERTYEYTFDTLRYALKGLREVFALVSRLKSLVGPDNMANGRPFDWTSIIHWPVTFPLEFLALLEQQCVEAWVLVAHYAMLPQKATHILWLDGWANNLITTTALVIGECNWDWIAWPATELDLDLERLRKVGATSIQVIPRTAVERKT